MELSIGGGRGGHLFYPSTMEVDALNYVKLVILNPEGIECELLKEWLFLNSFVSVHFVFACFVLILGLEVFGRVSLTLHCVLKVAVPLTLYNLP